MVEGGGLENRYGRFRPSGVRIPPSPPLRLRAVSAEPTRRPTSSSAARRSSRRSWRRSTPAWRPTRCCARSIPGADLGPARSGCGCSSSSTGAAPARTRSAAAPPRLRMRHAAVRDRRDAHDRWLRHMRAALDEQALAPDLDATPVDAISSRPPRTCRTGSGELPATTHARHRRVLTDAAGVHRSGHHGARPRAEVVLAYNARTERPATASRLPWHPMPRPPRPAR